jgi:hypothetical protein
MSSSISHKRRRGLHPAGVEGDGGDSESEASGEAPPLPTPVQFGGRFEEDYELGDQLGRGTFSVVRRCIHRRSGVARAVKIIDTRRFRLSSSFRSVSVLDEVRMCQACIACGMQAVILLMHCRLAGAHFAVASPLEDYPDIRGVRPSP